MSDTDSVLDSLMQDALAVSFAGGSEGDSCPPLPRVVPSARMGGGGYRDPWVRRWWKARYETWRIG